MSHAATVIPVTRRNFGILRTVFAISCPGCYRTEVRDRNTAEHIARLHNGGAA